VFCIVRHALLLVLLFGSASVIAAEPTHSALGADDVAKRPPPVNFQPGPEYSDSVRMFQGIPGIERAFNGRLWATWYGGGVGEDQNNYVMLVTSDDDGKTWSRLKLVIDPDRDCDEHMIVERHDGSLWMLVRTSYGVGQSVSTDQGKTWTEVAPGAIQHTVARFFIRRLASGKLLLVKHNAVDKRGDRSHLTAFLSKDEGKTWQGGLMLDDRGGVSYPDAVESPEGVIYVIYDYSRTNGKQILMATFTEADVAASKCVSPAARLRIVVNQATGARPK
jgi:hypothetical protein